MNPSAPIGIFDSGVGGLSIMRTIRELLPHEQLYYVADSGHVPYGEKSPDYLQDRAIAITKFLLTQQVKALVVACNTATVAAVACLRALFTIPIIAVEPAVKPAVMATNTGVVGIIATAATLNSVQFIDLLERFGHSTTILTRACPDLVRQVEQGDLCSDTTRRMIQRHTAPMLAAGADTLVLGCTHYPFLRPTIDDVVGSEVTLIDTSFAVARQLSRVLAAKHLLNPGQHPGGERFWTTGEPDITTQVCADLWGRSLVVRSVPSMFA